MKILNKILNIIVVFAITVSNFSFLPTVFAEGETNAELADGQVVGDSKEAGGTTNPGDVYLSKKVSATDEDGVYDVTLKTKGKNKVTTESQEVPIYAVVVFDRSGSMQNDYCNFFSALFNGCSWGQFIYKWDNAVAGAKEFARTLLNTYSKAEISLVTFATNVSSTEFANRNLDNANFGSPGGNTEIGKALREANRLLDSAPASANKYIVVISDGAPTDGNAYVTQANYAKEQGYEIFAIGYEDEGTALKNMVSDPKNTHYSDGNAFNISEVFSNIIDNIEVITPAATSATLSDVIGDNFEYVEGSAKLDGNAVTPTIDGKKVSYYINEVNETEKIFTFKIRLNNVDAPGLYDTNGEAKVEYPDGPVVINDTPQVNVKGYTYKVNYLEDGTNTVLETQEVRIDKLRNKTYSENAKEIAGYNYDAATKEITISEDNQEINFYYTKKTDYNYTVNYLEQGTNEVLHTAKPVSNKTYKETITETAEVISGYNVVGSETQEFVLDEYNKEINFYYTKKNNLVYTVEYYKDEVLNDVAHYINSKEYGNKTYKDSITSDMIDVNMFKPSFGYQDGVIKTTMPYEIIDGRNVIQVLYNKRNDLQYTVKYVDSVTKEEIINSELRDNKTYLETYEETAKDAPFGYNAAAEATKSITLTDDNMTLVFEYSKKNDFNYIVKYVDKDTKEEIAERKTKGNVTYNSEITETAKDITGYNLEGENTQTFNVDEYDKTITFEYSKKTDYNYIVKYIDKDTKEEISERKTKGNVTYNSEITETAKDITGYNLEGNSTQTFNVDEYDKTITFEYSKKTDYNYTVNYLEQGTNEVLHTAKPVSNKTYKETITETAEVISGYNVVGSETQEFVLDEYNKEINFYYTKKNNLVYTVEYYKDEVLNDVAHYINSKEYGNKTYKDSITSDMIDVNMFKPSFGYQDGVIKTTMPYEIIDGRNVIQVLYNKRNDLQYTVKYVDSVTKEEIINSELRDNKTYLETYEETAKDAPFGYNAAAEATKSITLTDDNMTLVFEYSKKNDFNYIVKYVDKDTKEEIAERKTKGNVTYNSEITETAKDITGYNLEGENTQTFNVDEYDKTITFEYSIKTDLSYTVNYYDRTNNEYLGYIKNNGMTYKSLVDIDDIDVNFKRPNGYKDGVVETELPYMIIDGENIIDVFYSIKDDLTYRVEYYYDNVIDDSKTEEYENIVYGTIINKYPDKLTDGYKFDKDSGELVVTDDKDNVIKVYYTKIEEEIAAPNTGVSAKDYLFLILGMLPLGLLSIKRELDKVSIMK